MQDIIFVSLENWDHIWRRNQFICTGLVRGNPGMRILFVEPERDVSHAFRSGQWGNVFSWPANQAGKPSGIECFRALKLFPNSLTLCRKWNEALLALQLRKKIKAAQFSSPILWINAHQAGHLVGKLGECRVSYDITDDWTELTQSPRLKKLIIQQDQELCQRADAVVVCSERLFALKESLCRNLHLIPNGVDPDHYSAGLGASNEPLPGNQWEKPVFGYTGSIHPDRVDVGLVASVARKMPEATFVLVGPLMLPDSDRKLLEECGNVILTGPVSYHDIPRYMAAFDVCITPHRITPFTESLNPIKLWEYFAFARPIVSTPVAGFRDYPNLVHLASDAESFVAALRDALSENGDLIKKRQAVAKANSWDNRLEKIEAVLGLL